MVALSFAFPRYVEQLPQNARFLLLVLGIDLYLESLEGNDYKKI